MGGRYGLPGGGKKEIIYVCGGMETKKSKVPPLFLVGLPPCNPSLAGTMQLSQIFFWGMLPGKGRREGWRGRQKKVGWLVGKKERRKHEKRESIETFKERKMRCLYRSPTCKSVYLGKKRFCIRNSLSYR